MLKIGVVFAIFGVILAQDCKSPPAFVQNEEPCCKMPNLEFRDALVECGLKLKETDIPTCEIMDCAFNKLKLSKDGKLDQEAIGAMFDENISKFPEFKTVFMNSKENCVKDFSGVAPEIACDSLKMFFCGQRFIVSECPDEFWNKSDECSQLKDFVEKCPSIF